MIIILLLSVSLSLSLFFTFQKHYDFFDGFPLLYCSANISLIMPLLARMRTPTAFFKEHFRNGNGKVKLGVKMGGGMARKKPLIRVVCFFKKVSALKLLLCGKGTV